MFQVMYFVGLFPFIAVIALLIKSQSLEGHEKGVEYLMTPDWSKLSDKLVSIPHVNSICICVYTTQGPWTCNASVVEYAYTN
jgi:SNF family Na+-dependent transporter